MTEQNFEIHDHSSLHKYRTELPNIILDMGLDPYELSLYLHLKRIAGDKGCCFASNKTLEKMTKMSHWKLVYTKKALVAKNLIKITRKKAKSKSDAPSIITILDMWGANFKHFSKKVYSGSETTGGGSETTGGGGSEATTEEELYKEEDLNINTLVATQPEAISFCFKKNEFIGIAQEKIDYWKQTFKEIDIVREIENATAWVKERPLRNKKRKQWIKFFEKTWFPRAVEGKISKSTIEKKEDDKDIIYKQIKPIYDRYTSWYSQLNDSYLLNLGFLVLTQNKFFDKKNNEFKYNLNLSKFIEVLRDNFFAISCSDFIS